VIFLMLALIYCFVLRSAAVASGTADAPLRLLFSLMCVSFFALLQVRARVRARARVTLTRTRTLPQPQP
jgi:hypothetical protein